MSEMCTISGCSYSDLFPSQNPILKAQEALIPPPVSIRNAPSSLLGEHTVKHLAVKDQTIHSNTAIDHVLAQQTSKPALGQGKLTLLLSNLADEHHLFVGISSYQPQVECEPRSVPAPSLESCQETLHIIPAGHQEADFAKTGRRRDTVVFLPRHYITRTLMSFFVAVDVSVEVQNACSLIQ